MTDEQTLGVEDLTKPRYYHGTKADLKIGDLIEANRATRNTKRQKGAYVYLSASVEAAIWGAELAPGLGRERVFIVTPTGTVEDDPDLRNQKFPGNPTHCHKTLQPLLVTGEVTSWHAHTAEQLSVMRGHLRHLKQLGIDSIGV